MKHSFDKLRNEEYGYPCEHWRERTGRMLSIGNLRNGANTNSGLPLIVRVRDTKLPALEVVL